MGNVDQAAPDKDQGLKSADLAGEEKAGGSLAQRKTILTRQQGTSQDECPAGLLRQTIHSSECV